MKKILIFATLFLSIFYLSSCNKNDSPQDNPDDPVTMEDLHISDNFDFRTSKDITFEFVALSQQNTPLRNVPVLILDKPFIDGGKVLTKGVTNENGIFETVYPIPTYYETVTVVSNYVGLISEQEIDITGSDYISLSLNDAKTKYSGISIPPKATSADILFLGGYDNLGVPDYLIDDDILDQQFLDDINASLPERAPLYETHPEYISNDNQRDLIIEEPAEVWVTFVHEGAGNKNVLGYYTYDLNNPPTSTADIDNITIIFPNTSYLHSGGGLHSGNKVPLGVFEANTGIGWVLFSNGWRHGQINTNVNTFYSNSAFNPETDPNLKQHSVLLLDPYRERLIIGFEDLHREHWCDNDFNDAIFYATATPFENINIDDIPTTDSTIPDSDGDGVIDTEDEYPNDPNKAFDNQTEGSLAFEDLWPGKGDYDFNDMVIDYDINMITNNQNKVSQINATYTLKAFGAQLHNGFGFQLNVDPSLVSSVEGIDIQENYISLNANNTEANQSKAVVIVFDDCYNILDFPGNSIGVNTTPGINYIEPVSLDITINFTSPVSISQIGTAPFNPFLIAGQDRGYEVHLPDNSPTDLANNELLGEWEDNSIPDQNRYYKTSSNLPWAINIAEIFDYPIEKTEIIGAHLKFAEWAESDGVMYPDWYLDNEGYRNNSNIYSIPE